MRINKKVAQQSIKKAKKKLKEKGDEYVNYPPHSANSGLSEVTEIASRKDEACTPSPSTDLAIPPTGDLPATITPDGESAVEILRKKRMRFTGKSLPMVHCNVCPHSQACPQHKPGYECAYSAQMLKRIDTIDDIPDFLRFIAEAEMSRYQQSLIFDQLSGGEPTVNTQIMGDNLFSKLKQIYQMSQEHGINPEEAKKGSIIEQLFGAHVDAAKPIDIETEETNEEQP